MILLRRFFARSRKIIHRVFSHNSNTSTGGRKYSVSPKFVVRCANSFEDFIPVFDYMVKEGWAPAVGDVEAYYSVDPSGCFVGELDGKKIAFHCVLKYQEYKLCSGGLFIVDPAYRGKGLGQQMLCFTSKSYPEDYNRVGDAVLHMAPTYEKYLGYKDCGWINQRYFFKPTNVPKIKVPSDVSFESIKGFDCDKLCDYEEKVVGVHRKVFMEKWVNFPGRYGWVAVSKEDQSVLGYVVGRATAEPNSHSIAPLYADNSDIAGGLLFKAATRLVGTSQIQCFIEIPTSNEQALKLVEQHSKGVIGELVVNRMFSKGMPDNVDLNKIFGVASLCTI